MKKKIVYLEDSKVRNIYDGNVYRIISELDTSVLVERDKSVSEMAKSDLELLETN